MNIWDDSLNSIIEEIYKEKKLLAKEEYDYIISQINEKQIKFDIQNKELIKAKNEIKGIQKKYREFYDYAFTSYMTIDINSTITEANSAAADMFGYSQNLLIGRPFILVTYAEERNKIDIFFKEVISTKQPKKSEFKLKKKEGVYFDAIIESIPVTEDNGKVYIINTIRDITYIKKIEQELKESFGKAELAIKAKSNFLANMSHELRTPLNGILGFSDYLIDNEKDDKKKELLDLIKNSGQNLLAIINDILDKSKIEAGMMKIVNESINLNIFLDKIEKKFTNLASEKENVFEIKKRFSSTKIITDELKLNQILDNLIGNSNKFTEKGRVILEVNESVIDSTNSVFIFKIIDTGIGISKEKMEHLFEKFEQGEATMTKKYGGTGLGLAIVKELTTMLGGEVNAETEVGKGTKFSLLIPVKTLKTESKDLIIYNESKDENIKQSLENYKILMVDDNESNIKLMEILIKGTKIKYDVAFEGKEALEYYKKNKYDLIIMDIQMPVLNGLQATKQIREIEAVEGKKKTNIVAVSAYAVKDEIDSAYRYGVDDYLIKPFKSSELLDKLYKWLVKT